MDLFFAEIFHPEDQILTLSPQESHHAIKVLRKQKGDPIDLTDGEGHYIQGIILEGSSKKTVIEKVKVEKRSLPPENRIEVALPIIRPNRMDWAVEKLTEMGIETIIPITCVHSSLRQIKKDHLRKIMISALKQSEQFYLPEIGPLTSITDWIKQRSNRNGNKYIAHKEIRQKTENSAKTDQNTFLAVGPEGGFHPEEINQALSAGFQMLNLGETLLRTETAAVVGVTKLKMILSLF